MDGRSFQPLLSKSEDIHHCSSLSSSFHQSFFTQRKDGCFTCPIFRMRLFWSNLYVHRVEAPSVMGEMHLIRCVRPLRLSVALFQQKKKKEKKRTPLDLSFWSFLTFLHHGIEKVERHLLWKFYKKIRRKSRSNVPPKLLACIGFLYKVVHKIGHLRKFNRSRGI